LNAVQLVNHSYEYFNFLPVVPDSVSFEPCQLVPGGTDCVCLNLGCAAGAAAALTGTGTFTNTTAAFCDQGGISGKAQRVHVALSSARHALNQVLHHALTVFAAIHLPYAFVSTA
jgi:hypothetical protein